MKASLRCSATPSWGVTHAAVAAFGGPGAWSHLWKIALGPHIFRAADRLFLAAVRWQGGVFAADARDGGGDVECCIAMRGRVDAGLLVVN